MPTALGNSWDIPDSLLLDLEEYTCLLYNRKQFKSVDDLRYHMFKEKCDGEEISPGLNVDLSTLPPCKRSLMQHVRRANFQAAIWKRAHESHPDVPDAADGHGWEWRDGFLQPLWTAEEEELVLPDAVIQELFDEQIEEDDQEQQQDHDITCESGEDVSDWEDSDEDDI